MQPIISVVICTYNQDKLLKSAINSIVAQTTDSKKYELIIVDNNSTDNTKHVAEEFIGKHENIFYTTETSQGLSFARNKGYKTAKSEYVAYMDDDAQANPDWIETAVKIIEEHRPDIFGGPIFPFYLYEKPKWFSDKFEIRKHFDKTGWLKKGKGNFSGSNIFFKRKVLEEFNGFNTELGMKGKKLAYGEETQLIEKAQKSNKKLYYSLELKVQHNVPDYKTNRLFIVGSSLVSGKSGYQLNKVNNPLVQESLTDRDKYNILYNNIKDIENSIENYLNELKSNKGLSEFESILNAKKLFYNLGYNMSLLEDTRNKRNEFFGKYALLIKRKLKKRLKKVF